MAKPHLILLLLLSLPLLCTTSCLWRGDSHANAKERDYNEFYAQYSTLTPDELNTLAEEYIKGQKPDSAMACYSVAASIDQASGQKEVLERRTKTLNGMGYVLLYHKGDILNAYDRFLQARDLAETNGFQHLLPPILINLGNITMAKDPKEAAEYYSRALQKALDAGDFRNANTAYSNLINRAIDANDMKSVASQMQRFAARPSHKTIPLDRYISAIHAGAVAFAKGDYEEAARHFSEAAENPDTPLSPVRYRLQALGNRTEALLLASDTLTALALMREIDSLATASGIADIRLSTYGRAADIYLRLGNHASAEAFRNRYYQLTDSLYSFSHGYDLMNVENNFNLRTMNRQVEELEHTSRVRKRILWGALALILLISAIALAIWLQKRRVDRLLTNLYEKNRLLMANVPSLPDNSAPERSGSLQSADVRPSPEAGPPSADENPDSSPEMAAILQRTMEMSDRIYSLGFSISDLAEMTGIREKTLSQLINSHWGMNFNTYLNGYRMREAARRLENPDYDNLTIEALAESIGLRNRSHFASLFRAATGMSPAEYRRAASLARLRRAANGTDGHNPFAEGKNG